jgi:hypothetical protein
MTMLTTLIAAALAAAAPAAAGQTPDPHAGHGKHGMTGELHGDMCKDCKSDKGCCEHKGADGNAMDCCKEMASADKANCCAEHAHHGEQKAK